MTLEHRHTLFLAGTTAGEAVECTKVALPDFQVHGMRRHQGIIEMTGRIGVLCIDLTARNVRPRAEKLPESERPANPRAKPPNPNEWSDAGAVRLRSCLTAHDGPVESLDRRSGSEETLVTLLPWPGHYKLSITTGPTKKECTRIVRLVLLSKAIPFVLLRREYAAGRGE